MRAKRLRSICSIDFGALMSGGDGMCGPKLSTGFDGKGHAGFLFAGGSPVNKVFLERVKTI
jgi:hypothetical protein